MRLDAEEGRAIDAACARLGVSRSDLLRAAVAQFLKNPSVEELSAYHRKILEARRELDRRIQAAARVFNGAAGSEARMAFYRQAEADDPSGVSEPSDSG